MHIPTNYHLVFELTSRCKENQHSVVKTWLYLSNPKNGKEAQMSPSTEAENNVMLQSLEGELASSQQARAELSERLTVAEGALTDVRSHAASQHSGLQAHLQQVG